MSKLDKLIFAGIVLLAMVFPKVINYIDMLDSTKRLLSLIGLIGLFSFSSISLYQKAKTKTNLILMVINVITTLLLFPLIFFKKIRTPELFFGLMSTFTILFGVQIFYSIFTRYKNYKNNKTQD